MASPKLLMLSGVGPADHLTAHGIPVVTDSPGVGANLQEHPFATMIWLVSTPTLNTEVTPVRAARHAVDFAVRRRGALTSPFSHAVLFGHLAEHEPWSQYEVIFSPFGVVADTGTTADGGEQYHHDVHRMRLERRPAVVAAACLLHPRARGTVTLRSSRPDDPPVINHSLLGDPHDVAQLAEACRRVREVFEAPGMKDVVLEEARPGSKVQSDAEWVDYLSRFAIRGQHPVGTCRMGSDAEAVVDPQLRVTGVDALRVVDASIMPTLTSGNTNCPAIMIGEVGADLIVGRRLQPGCREPTFT